MKLTQEKSWIGSTLPNGIYKMIIHHYDYLDEMISYVAMFWETQSHERAVINI